MVSPSLSLAWAAMLQPLGVTELEEQLYRVLLDMPDASRAELVQVLGHSRGVVERALGRLESLGLVARLPVDPPRFAAAPPDLALEAALLQREQELRLARAEKDRLLDAFSARTPSTRRRMSLDLVRGFEATRQRWIQVQHSAVEQVRILDRPPYVMPPGTPNSEELALLKKGIRFRVIYDESALEIPGKLAAARACVLAGEEARVTTKMPMKLIVADMSLGLTHEFPSDPMPDAIVIYRSSMLDGLIELFDMLWEKSTPLDGGPDPVVVDPDIDAVDRAILSLLAAGAKDEAIARRLGLGVRTVRRRVAGLMSLLGATTRFEAGVRAAQQQRV